jgi:hypothetical protein
MIATILKKTVSLARVRAIKEIYRKLDKSKDPIVIDGRKKLRINGAFGGNHTVREIRKDGEIHCWNMPNAVTVLQLESLSTENLIAILAELESK